MDVSHVQPRLPENYFFRKYPQGNHYGILEVSLVFSLNLLALTASRSSQRATMKRRAIMRKQEQSAAFCSRFKMSCIFRTAGSLCKMQIQTLTLTHGAGSVLRICSLSCGRDGLLSPFLTSFRC
ncbi:Hypothetical_protein [Hexamita inflata]|uniref:Hypothetical_protein n=1 Tax=Hexamita inflata TaxID=28002 RepID=A0AA86U9Y0_9EUKA|nr:Hypothetical protein HINF_LOCUS34634 [Hexamita inflata]